MTLTFTTVRNLKMGLPIGAVSPIDFSKYEGSKCVVLRPHCEYLIRAPKPEEVQNNG